MVGTEANASPRASPPAMLRPSEAAISVAQTARRVRVERGNVVMAGTIGRDAEAGVSVR